MRKYLTVAIGAVLSVAASQGAARAATVLTGDLTADNYFFAYLSDSFDTQGTLLAGGDNWLQTYSFTSAPLTPGKYYLNVVAQNWTGEAGLVGSFSVDGKTFDTSTSWKTAYVPGAWSLDTPLPAAGPSWSTPTGTAFDLGKTDVAFWGAFYPSSVTSIDGNAEWIWGNDSSSFPDKTEQFYDGVGYYAGVCQTCTVEFQTSFTVDAVPEMSTWGMMLLGFAGVGLAGYVQARKHTGAATAG